jgi:hypothetical protein
MEEAVVVRAQAQAVDAFKKGREAEAGEVCRGLVKTHHPGGRLGGAKLGPASGVVGSAMLVTFPDVLTAQCGGEVFRGRECKSGSKAEAQVRYKRSSGGKVSREGKQLIKGRLAPVRNRPRCGAFCDIGQRKREEGSASRKGNLSSRQKERAVFWRECADFCTSCCSPGRSATRTG